MDINEEIPANMDPLNIATNAEHSDLFIQGHALNAE